MNQRINLLLPMVLVLLSGCSSKLHHPAPLPDNPNKQQLVELWKIDVGAYTWDSYLRITPAVYDNVVYTGDKNGLVMAVDINTGKKLWSKKYSKKFTSDIAVSDSYIMIGTADANVLVLDRATAKQLFLLPVSNEVISRPAYSKGIFIIKSVDNVLHAFDANTGKLLWNYSASFVDYTMRVGSAPVIKGDKVYAGFTNGSIAVLSLITGKLLWEDNTNSSQQTAVNDMVDIDVDPKFYHANMYVAGLNGNIMAIDTSVNEIIWKKTISTHSGLDVDRASLIITDSKGEIYLYRRNNGRLVWKQSVLKHRELTAPVIGKGLIFVADNEGYLHILSSTTGEILGYQKVHSTGVVVRPIGVGNKLLVKSNNGYLHCYQLQK